MDDRIEILNVDLLEHQADLVRAFRDKAHILGIQLGWHYVLDLSWVASRLGEPRGKRILDAGAGVGVLQWWLADQGAEIVSVDRANREDLSCRFRLRYRVEGLRPSDLLPTWKLVSTRLTDRSNSLRVRIAGATRAALTTFLEPITPKAPGRVSIYHQDLKCMPDLLDEGFDAVVSISALEHNQLGELCIVVDEQLRVLKSGGVMLATLAASSDRDWFHEPSKGWCFSEESLREAFRLPECVWSNYSESDALFTRLRNCTDLRQNLAPMFYQSGDNGMPWGVWDPKYQPVGVRKFKPFKDGQALEGKMDG